MRRTLRTDPAGRLHGPQPEVEAFAREYGYPVVSVADIVRYRLLKEQS